MFFKRFAKRAPVIFRRQQKKISRLFRIFKKNILKPLGKYLSRKYATIKNPILLTRLATILVIISMIGGFGYRVFATPLYQPGETLNPTCGPSTTDCTVSVMGVSTSGTTNYLIKWGSATAGTNSIVYDDGTNVGIGTTSPLSKLDIVPTGTFAIAGVSGVTTRAHTVTLSGVNPTTYATFSANQIGALTLIGTNANQTVTNAAGFHITSAPVKSTNVALTNTHGLLISAGAVSTATNSYGLTVNAQTGATNNYSAAFLGGNVGIGTTTPEVGLDVRRGSDGEIAYFIGAGIHGVTYGTNLGTAYLTSTTSETAFGFGINGDYDTWHISALKNVGIQTTDPTANFQVAQSVLGIGAVTISGGSPNLVLGTNTQFLNTFKVGDTITLTTTIGVETRTIINIGSNTAMTVGSDFLGTASNVEYSLDGGTRFAVKGNGNVGIGTTTPLSKLHIASQPTASSYTGTLSLGGGAFDGATSGFFNGNSLGTSIAVNEVSGYEGSLLDLQVGGVSKFKIDYNGSLNPVNGVGSLGTNTNRFGAIYLQSGLFNTNNAMILETTMSGAGGTGFKFQNALTTNGTDNNDFAFMYLTNTFNPTSGSARYSDILIDSTISQTGPANGITSSIQIRPNITSVVDYRAIYIEPNNEHNATNFYGIYIANTEGYGIYQDSSTTPNYFAGGASFGTTSNTYLLQAVDNSTSGVVARFENSSGSCDIDPTSTALVCSSDINKKKNIVALTDFTKTLTAGDYYDPLVMSERLVFSSEAKTLDRILALTPVMYNWNTELDTDEKHIGFIAQEVEMVFPDLVATDPNTGFKSLNYMGLTPYLVKSIQDQHIQIEELRLQIAGISSVLSTQSSVGQMMSEFFSSVVKNVSGGIADFKYITVETLKIGSPGKRTGITLYDEIDGSPYCISVSGGVQKTTPGECNVVEVTPPTDDGSDAGNIGGGDSGSGDTSGDVGGGGSDASGTDDTVVSDPLPPVVVPPSDEEDQIISSDDTTSNENDTPPETQI